MLLLRLIQAAYRDDVSAALNEILTERAVLFCGDYAAAVKGKSHRIQRIGNAYADGLDVAFLENIRSC